MTSADRDAGQVNSRPRPVKQREKSGLDLEATPAHGAKADHLNGSAFSESELNGPLNPPRPQSYPTVDEEAAILLANHHHARP